MSYVVGDLVIDPEGHRGAIRTVGNYDACYEISYSSGLNLWWMESSLTPAALQYDEAVNHPAHYNSDPSGVECIEVVRHRTFNVGAAMKYLWRNGLKDADAQVEDLRKAVWHIEDEIKRLGGEA